MGMENTVLIVDDDEIGRGILRSILEDTYEIVEAENGKQAIEILERDPEKISAVVMDFLMPEMNGHEFMKYYRDSMILREIPVIITTVENNIETERKCLELGAWDFISKPYDAAIIQFRVKNAIERSERQLNRQLMYRAEYDTLTDIYNKEKFYYNTRKMIDQNPEEKFALLRIDIQKFQLVNAFFGSREGDKLLRYFASFLREDSKVRHLITYGYIRADIFSVCMAYHRKREISAYIDRVIRVLSEYPIDFDIVPAIGIYLVEDREISIREMYERANLATKKCKGNYIHNFAYYEPEMTEAIMKEQLIVNNMRNALKQNQFVLYLQPKYELQTNSLAGAEVLVRWKDPERGMISPGDFIPVFEQNGFIMKLDYYVWDKTCQLIHKWLEEGKTPYPVSVNISRVSMYNPKIVEVICGLVEKYNIPPELLQLELTESAYTNNQQTIKKMMEQLQKRGFYVLMDDFGSGYSSLNVLKDIAVNILKIDMKFLSDTDNIGRSENILASVVRMAKWLSMPVVAEGVERKEQVSFLRSIGCEYVQGYYFARPMPVEEYEALAFASEKHFTDPAQVIADKKDDIWSSASQMELIFSNMIQAVVMYEYENGCAETIRVNNAYYDMLGYSDINHTKKKVGEELSCESRKILMEAFEKVVETEDVTECEFQRGVEKRNIWINLKLKYINRVGNKHIIFGCLTDITTQKEIDAELQKYREALKTVSTTAATMLVVDDAEVNRVSLRSIFENRYQILEAENGQEALEILESGASHVDIILLDLVMPVMDGPEFLKIKQEKADLAEIPVVIITADDTTKKQIETMQLGANDYIVKPFIPEVVVRRVENVMGSTRNLRQMFQKSVAEQS